MEHTLTQISREQFDNILKGIGCSPKINKDILFDLFENAIVGANTLSEFDSIVSSNFYWFEVRADKGHSPQMHLKSY